MKAHKYQDAKVNCSKVSSKFLWYYNSLIVKQMTHITLEYIAQVKGNLCAFVESYNESRTTGIHNFRDWCCLLLCGNIPHEQQSTGVGNQETAS
jgi:hypothetical protein